MSVYGLWVSGIQWLSDVIKDLGSLGLCSLGFISPSPEADSLWFPIAVSSCEVERWFLGVSYEPRTTFQEASNRSFLMSHWLKLDHMAFLDQYLARGMGYLQTSEAFLRAGDGAPSLEAHRFCWEVDPRLLSGPGFLWHSCLLLHTALL